MDKWISWSLEKSLSKREKDGKLTGTANIDGISQLLLGRNASTKDKAGRQAYEAFVKMIVEGQQKNGTWKPAGQLPLQRRSKTESTAVTTMWNTLALTSVGQSKQVIGARDRALAWLKRSKPGKSHEWYLGRLLLDHRLGRMKDRNRWLKKLRSLQQADGGWSWMLGDKSDAFATGQSLYALRAIGIASDDPAIAKAQAFLVKTQQKDGSWLVNGTKAKRGKRPQETAIYWGTAWATIGLLETLPKNKTAD